MIDNSIHQKERNSKMGEMGDNAKYGKCPNMTWLLHSSQVIGLYSMGFVVLVKGETSWDLFGLPCEERGRLFHLCREGKETDFCTMPLCITLGISSEGESVL